jgi:hypothetical protein
MNGVRHGKGQSLKRRVRYVTLILAGVSVMLAIACSSNTPKDAGPSRPTGTAASPSPAAHPPGTLTNDQGWPRVEGLRSKRYCEVLLATVVDGRLNAAVWNSFGLNDCPDAAWKALDATAIKTERGVLAALLNGPRYWLMDAIEKKPGTSERKTTTFGTLEMFLAATVDLGPVPPNLAPYSEHRVARETVFEYSKGAEVYELTAADGKVYVMQSYSQQSDASLSEGDLPGLAGRLTLPAGWTFRTRKLDSTLRVLTPGSEAVVLQDDLSNTYQLIAPN